MRSASQIRALLPAVVLFVGAVAGPACAQIRMASSVEHRTVLQFEPLYMFIRVRNETAVPLAIGNGPNMARLRVLARVGRDEVPSKPIAAPAIKEAVVVPVDGEKLIMADLTHWCDVRRPANYNLRAELTWRGQSYRAKDIMVDVVPGIEIARVVKPVPWEGGADRTYSLRYWSRDGAVHLFLRVDEQALGLNYGVFLLGEMLRSHKPSLTVTREGEVSVAHQSEIDRYTISSFLSEPTRVIFVKQTHRMAERPRY